jgi:hypothetical protein
MQIYEQIQKQAETILTTFRANGLNLSITDKQTLRIVGTATKRQLEFIRVWKQQIIETLSPKCSNCVSPMRLIENGNLWFCPLGCQFRERRKENA